MVIARSTVVLESSKRGAEQVNEKLKYYKDHRRESFKLSYHLGIKSRQLLSL